MTSAPFASLREAFEKSRPAGATGSLVSFKGLEGYDVFNCSAPFTWSGRQHIFARFEKRAETAQSRSCMFASTGADEFTALTEQIVRQLEDPFVAVVDAQFVFGGTQVVKDIGQTANRYCDLYRGATPERSVYFSTGADRLEHVRIVQLADRRVGIFAELPHSQGCGIGFTTAPALAEVKRETTAAIAPIDGVVFGGATGSVNHAYLLTSGLVGCIAHHRASAGDSSTCATSFVFDPVSNTASDLRVLATPGCFPVVPPKSDDSAGRVFPSGIVMREDGKCDLYCGLGDTSEGRITIDYPFEGHGDIASGLVF